MNIGKQYIAPTQPVREGLQQLYGVGSFLSNQICDHLGFHKTYKIKDLTHSQSESLVRILETFYTFEVKLKVQQKSILQELIQMRSTRGLRRQAGLPSRGQRTHTNGRTAAKFRNKS